MHIRHAMAPGAIAFAILAQTPEPSLRIVSPIEGSYVSGPLVLHASVDPADAGVAQVTFFADGQLVCTLEAAPFECAWNAGVGVRPHAVRAVAVLRDGRRLVRNARTSDGGFAENIDVDVVQVTATVTDNRGRFVRGLGREAFRILEDSVPQRINHFAAESVPLELVVAVDASESMAASMSRVKLAVKKFLSALQPADRVTVLAFNNNIFTLARPEADPAARLRAIDRLTAWGSTALYDVILKGHDLLGRQRGRRALVIFTDGQDRSSRGSLQTVRDRVDASDVALYFIAQGRGAEVESLRKLLEQLASVSGGRVLLSRKIADLEEDFARITDELSNQYLLSYVPGNRSRDMSFRRISVEVADGRHRVRARHGYRAVASR